LPIGSPQSALVIKDILQEGSLLNVFHNLVKESPKSVKNSRQQQKLTQSLILFGMADVEKEKIEKINPYTRKKEEMEQTSCTHSSTQDSTCLPFLAGLSKVDRRHESSNTSLLELEARTDFPDEGFLNELTNDND
jgi:hypothetical protein